MSDRYGDNLTWFLTEIQCADEIEDAWYDIYGENENGVEGSTQIDIRDLCGEAKTKIESLQSQLSQLEKTNLELQFQNNLMMEKQARTKIPEGVTGEVKTPAKGEPMPRTIEHYQANALRDQELILEQRDEIAKLKQKINKLEQRK